MKDSKCQEQHDPGDEKGAAKKEPAHQDLVTKTFQVTGTASAEALRLE